MSNVILIKHPECDATVADPVSELIENSDPLLGVIRGHELSDVTRITAGVASDV